MGELSAYWPVRKRSPLKVIVHYRKAVQLADVKQTGDPYL